MIIFYTKPFQLRKQWLAFELLYKSDISPRRNLKYLFASWELSSRVSTEDAKLMHDSQSLRAGRCTNIYKTSSRPPNSVLVSLLTY